MDAMIMKIDAQYKELQSHPKQPTPDHNDDDTPVSRQEEEKFIQTFHRTRFYNDYHDRDMNHDNWRSSRRNDYNRDNYRSNTDDKPYDVQRQLSDFMKAQQLANAFVKDTFMELKTQLEATTKNYQASIQNLEAKFNRLADKQSARPSGSLLVNPNDQQINFETPINFDSENKDDESTPQPNYKTPKPVKETLIPKPYKPKVPYPQRLRKQKMKAQYGKFLDMIQAVRINIPLVDVLAGMPNYGNFLKELLSNKHKLEHISTAFLRDESFTMIQNKVPPKLGEPGSFLISRPIIPIPYWNSENMLVEVGKFTFLVDFVILEMNEDSKVPLILGRPFLHIADAIIRVKQKQLNLRVRTERMIFHINSAMKHSYSNDDTCFSIDVIDEILEEDFDALLDEGSEILHSIEGAILKEKLFSKLGEFMAITSDESFESESNKEEPKFEKITFNFYNKIKSSLEKPHSKNLFLIT
nr:reverse transcriptase domain-containing protein [Tanacetum cinerariifolium]